MKEPKEPRIGSGELDSTEHGTAALTAVEALKAERSRSRIQAEREQTIRSLNLLKHDYETLPGRLGRLLGQGDGDVTWPVVVSVQREEFYESFMARLHMENYHIVLEQLHSEQGVDRQGWSWRRADIDLSSGHLSQQWATRRGQSEYNGVPIEEADEFSNIPGVFFAQAHNALGDISMAPFRDGQTLSVVTEEEFDIALQQARERSS